jgi:hypothetical protein
VIPRDFLADVTIPETHRPALISWLRSLDGKNGHGNYVRLTWEKPGHLTLTLRDSDDTDSHIHVAVSISGESRPPVIAFAPGYPTHGNDRNAPCPAESLEHGLRQGHASQGGFELDLDWKDGKPSAGVLRSLNGEPCRLRSTTPLTVTSKGRELKIERSANGVLSFETEPGASYTLVADGV